MPQLEAAKPIHEPSASDGLPVAPPTTHLGWQALLEAHRLLAIDDAHTTWHPDGFTWRAHRLAQRLRVEGPAAIDGVPTGWVGVETACLRGADPASERVWAWMAAQNGANRLGALVLEGDRVRLRVLDSGEGRDGADRFARPPPSAPGTPVR